MIDFFGRIRREEEKILNSINREKGYLAYLPGLSDEEIEKFNREIINSWERYRPNSINFQDIYGERARKDREQVINFEKRPSFKKEKPDAALALEYIVMNGIYDCNWLGENAIVTPASRYDDYFNQIDIVVSFNIGEKRRKIYYLGIDITTASRNEEVLKEKIENIEQQLKAKKLSEVKYFQSMDTDDKERGRREMPRVIISAKPEKVGKLAKLALENRGRGLANDEIKYQFIYQIERQLMAEINYLLRNNGLTNQWFEDYQSLKLFIKNHKEKIRKDKQLSKIIESHFNVLKIIERNTRKEKDKIEKFEKKKGPHNETLNPNFSNFSKICLNVLI